ncbi:MAG TPA: hypothetical protein ENI26_05670 [Methylophaga aminisulfidivorans]|uniref:TolC family protein n=2 Tax=root TaxID=1 RepID=A0A7C1ZGZ9_9GAMM|nr:hypothetical protein [Methylophaga aminisulfidivorans]
MFTKCLTLVIKYFCNTAKLLFLSTLSYASASYADDLSLGNTLSLSEAIIKTTTNNPSLNAFSYQHQFQAGQRQQAALNPALSLGVD